MTLLKPLHMADSILVPILDNLIMFGFAARNSQQKRRKVTSFFGKVEHGRFQKDRMFARSAPYQSFVAIGSHPHVTQLKGGVHCQNTFFSVARITKEYFNVFHHLIFVCKGHITVIKF